MRDLLASLAKPSLDWLMVFLPIAIVLEIMHARPTWIFAASALAIVPVAGWMGHATEHLSARTGEGIGGLLNATFGNAAELIIAAMALWQASRDPDSVERMHNLVKASLTGSIIGNVLLVLGAALLAGGLKFKIQSFNPTAARTGATLLLLAVVALLIPDLFAYVIPPTARPPLASLSLELSVLLLVVYALSLVFSLHTHRHLYTGAAEQSHPADGAAEHAPWSVKKAVGVLVAATIGVAVLAHFMIGSVEAAAKTIGLTEMFVGVIVVAIVGNAAEHSTAILVALRNRMDLSLGIAIGSSIQIALFITPVLVLLSHALGVPMNLVFTPAEMLAVAISVFVLSQIAGDGESNWLEGVFLLVVYTMLGVLFYHLPAEASG